VRARFAAHLERSGLLDGCGRVLVALSGGLDSVCLLHLLRFPRAPFDVEAAHFDHAMRDGSAADAAWVRGLCRAWEVPLHEARAERAPRSESEARDMRYEFLEAVAARSGAEAILTAHHADDQAETVLFRLARGTGLAGLAGIPARRGNIARPLLPFERSEVRAFAQRAGIRWRDDPTNVDLRYARNRLRHVVLPELERAQPGAARRIASLAQRAAEAESAWQGIVHEATQQAVTDRDDTRIQLARERLLGYHPHVRARVLRQLLRDSGHPLDRAGTRVAMEFISSGSSGTRVELAGGVRLEREFDHIVLHWAATAVTSTADAGPAPSAAVLRIAGPEAGAGSFVAAGRQYDVRWWCGTESDAVRGGSDAVFDAAALHFPLELRVAAPGDRIHLGYGSKKLKKLFPERRIGRAQRARVPVLYDATGSVLWVVGVARSSMARPGTGSRDFTITVLDGES
jgi:tRNA(Ile)-lysidine synthase